MDSPDVNVRKTACWFCYQNCGLLAYVKDGKILSIEGDLSHPISEGARCQRNYAWREFLDHSDRVNYPLKRSGQRGDNKWQRISWTQALDEISTKLEEIKEKHGAEAVASLGGTNRTDDWARRRFFNLYGSPNISHIAPICGINAYVIESSIYGWVAEPDFTDTKAIVAWGHNPAVSYLPEMRRILDAIESGAKLIVIDPRFTETASKADLWLQIRPGSDSALALAWLNVIIEEKLYDSDFIEKHTFGFEKLEEHVKKYTPRWAEKLTGIPVTKIIESARLYANSKPACFLWGVAGDHLGLASTPFVQTRAILRAITGNLDVPGGNKLSGPHPTFITDSELELNDMLPEAQRKKQIGSDRFRLMAWPGYEILSAEAEKHWGKAMPTEWTCLAHVPSIWRTIIDSKPYRIGALLVVANNPLVAYANSNIVNQAYSSKNLELNVVMDFWITPSAALADYVLPAASWLERPLITTTFGTCNWFIASERAIEPLYERKTDFDFWRELGIRLGQEMHWPWKTLEEANQHRISSISNDTYENFVEKVRIHTGPYEYKQYLKKGFGTPTGKVELYSTVLERLGYDPLPSYIEPTESPFSTPVLAKQFPYILITGNFLPYHHSEGRQIKLLRKTAPEPLVQLHPNAARKLGVKEGDWVYVETKRGKVKLRASLYEGINPRVVFVQKGWWFPEESGELPNLFGLWKSNINVCTDDDPDKCDKTCGSWIYRALLCKVYKKME